MLPLTKIKKKNQLWIIYQIVNWVLEVVKATILLNAFHFQANQSIYRIY